MSEELWTIVVFWGPELYLIFDNPIDSDYVFRLLWDDFIAGQDFNGPFDTIMSLVPDFLQMISMVLARLDDTSRRLTDSRVCNATFYPSIPDDSSDLAHTRFQQSVDAFIRHIM